MLIGLYVLRQNGNKKLNLLAAIEYFGFGWWSLFHAFIYIAPTADEAMLWHRMASIGWGLFCPIAIHFFLIMFNCTETVKSYKPYFLIYLVPAAIIINAIFNPAGTSVTSGFMKSDNAGWVYITNYKSAWYWMYLLYIIFCFTICLKKYYFLAIKSNKRRYIKQAKSVIILVAVVLLLGIFLELILPIFYHEIPPVCHFVAFFWAFGFLYILKVLKLTSPEDAVTPDIILKTVVDPILVLDKDGFIMKCNKATGDLLKLDLEQIIGKPLAGFFASGKYDDKSVHEIFSGKHIRNQEIVLIDNEKNEINTTASFSLAETKLDGPVGIVASFHDVTALKKIQKELKQRNEKNQELSKRLEILANYDALTNLPNRRFFLKKVDSAIKEYNNSGKQFALLYLDLDGFKKINDIYGHNIGDILLQRSSEIVKSIIRKSDFISRIGGDEFILLFDNFSKLYLEKLTNSLKTAFSKPILIEGCICSIGLSIGIAECPEDGISQNDLIKCADNRMYSDKSKKVL